MSSLICNTNRSFYFRKSISKVTLPHRLNSKVRSKLILLTLPRSINLLGQQSFCFWLFLQKQNMSLNFKSMVLIFPPSLPRINRYLSSRCYFNLIIISISCKICITMYSPLFLNTSLKQSHRTIHDFLYNWLLQARITIHEVLFL